MNCLIRQCLLKNSQKYCNSVFLFLIMSFPAGLHINEVQRFMCGGTVMARDHDRDASPTGLIDLRHCGRVHTAKYWEHRHCVDQQWGIYTIFIIHTCTQSAHRMFKASVQARRLTVIHVKNLQHQKH